MNAYKLAATLLEDGTLLLQGLPFQAGETVEVIILEQPQAAAIGSTISLSHPLQGTVLRYDDPFEPAVIDEDWEVLQ